MLTVDEVFISSLREYLISVHREQVEVCNCEMSSLWNQPSAPFSKVYLSFSIVSSFLAFLYFIYVSYIYIYMPIYYFQIYIIYPYLSTLARDSVFIVLPQT